MLTTVIRVSVVLLAALLSPAIMHGQTVLPGSFRIELGRMPEGFRPAIEGYVYNDSQYRVGTMRLRVELLDGANRVMSERFAWVYGDIDAGGRAYFVLPLPESERNYRITVESFLAISRQTP